MELDLRILLQVLLGLRRVHLSCIGSFDDMLVCLNTGIVLTLGDCVVTGVMALCHERIVHSLTSFDCDLGAS